METRLSELIAPSFHEIHAMVRRGEGSEYWLGGGRGSGKSSFASIEIVLGLLKDPEAHAMVYRKVASTLRESVLEQVAWAAGALGVGHLFRFKVTPPEGVYLPTGQRILFRGADDPGKSKSIKLADGLFKYLWFEEVTEFSGMEDVLSIKASVIRGGRAVTFFTYNPPRSARNWVNEEALLERPGRVVHRSDYRSVPEAWLGDGFLEEAEGMRRRNERMWRHVYLGEVTGSGGQVFDNLEIRQIPDEEIGRQGKFLNGLDFGFAVDPDALIRVAYDGRRREVFLIGEYCAARTPVDRLAAEAKRIAGQEAVRCDSADPRMIQELRERGVYAVPAKKGPGSVAHGIRWMQELDRIVIDPARCPNAAREFSGYEYGQDGRGGFTAEFPDRDNHLIDAARYALEPVMLAREARTVSRAQIGI